jgi:hypothetical protein
MIEEKKNRIVNKIIKMILKEKFSKKTKQKDILDIMKGIVERLEIIVKNSKERYEHRYDLEALKNRMKKAVDKILIEVIINRIREDFNE